MFNLTSDINDSPHNTTYDTSYIRHPFFNVLGSLATVIISMTATVGNIAVIIASFWDETLRVQSGNFLIVYLAATDVLTSIIIMLPSAIAVGSDSWIFGYSACKVHAYFNYMFACSSGFNIALISVDRAIAISYPFKYRSMMSTKVILGFCGFNLMVSVVIGIACVWGDWVTYDYQEGVCAMDYTSNTGAAYSFNTGCAVCFVLPCLMISTCYALIIRAAKDSGKATQTLFVRRGRNALKQPNVDSRMRKTIKSMVVVVVTFYMCFTPYAMTKEFKVISGKDAPPWMNYLTTIFIYIASATNPFIYAIFRKDYREAFKRLLKL